MDGVGGADDDSDDTLQVTIEKSKKVLAMQRDLLQQVSFVIVFVLYQNLGFGL